MKTILLIFIMVSRIIGICLKIWNLKCSFALLLFIPFLGIAQTESWERKLSPFDFSPANSRPINSYNSTENRSPKPLASKYSNLIDENKNRLDSFHRVEFKSPLDSTLFVREYYEYDENGRVILLINFNLCYECSGMGPSHTIESEYDFNGNRTKEISSLWNRVTKQFVLDFKKECSYDNNGLVLQDNRSKWNISNNQWVNWFKYEYEYNSKLALTHHAEYKGDNRKGNWVNVSKEDRKYDENGHPLLIEYSVLDTITNQWDGSTKDEFEYTNDKCTSQLKYDWNNVTDQWIYDTKAEMEYDQFGNETAETVHNWDPIKSLWVGYYKRTITYDTNGKMTNYTNILWDSTLEQWVGSQKTDCTYDANGNEIEWISNKWDINTSQWKVVEKGEGANDALGNELNRSISSWDSFTNQWIKYRSFEFTHSVNGLPTSNSISYWNKVTEELDFSTKNEYTYDSEGNYTLLVRSIRNSLSDEWNIETISRFYYSLHLANNSAITKLPEIKIYPNPVTDFITIEDATSKTEQYLLQIMDLGGRQIIVKNIDLNPVYQLDVSGLQEGMYLLKLKRGGKQFSKLMIKQP